MSRPAPKRIRRKPGEPPRPMGRPRDDGAPPVQRKAIEEAENEGPPPPPRSHKELIAKVREYAREGGMPEHVAALVRVPVEDLKPGGRLYEEFAASEAWGLQLVARNHFKRARNQTGNPLPAMHILNEKARWKDKPEKAKDDEELREIVLRVVDEFSRRVASPGRGTKPRGSKEEAAEAGAGLPALGGPATSEG